MPPLLRLCAPLLLAFLLAPCPVLAQVLTKGGDPVYAVIDPSKAQAVGKTTAKAPPLAAGQTVRCDEEKDGTAVVVVETGEPGAGSDSDFRYRIPLAALRALPGKTWQDRPDWLPAPAPAGTESRDVAAFEDGDWIAVLADGQPARRLARGRLPAVSPDASMAAFSPAGEKGLRLVPLSGPGKGVLIPVKGGEPLEKCFSPDGKRLAWRVDHRIDLLDMADPKAQPRTVLRGLDNETTLQGFTSDGERLVLQDMHKTTWTDLSGATRRVAPIGEFTDDPWGSTADHYIPSPTAPALLLVARDVNGTPAFSRWANDASAALYLFDGASGTNYRLTPRAIAAVAPTWSPDGRRVYFAGLPDAPPRGWHHLYRVNIDGTGLTDLGKGLNPSVGTRP
ncbi:biopolymer transporter Tol [Solidesulfovibrio sp.]|uniref:TolB family protein n=1 Tax=Solidesulfovibrio sp. TaxID=2910990 RepID=UPI00260966E2|nr:biopolymer transporter Tol [Solidesulfovibrio sp.]